MVEVMADGIRFKTVEGVKRQTQEILNSDELWSKLTVDEKLNLLKVSMGLPMGNSETTRFNVSNSIENQGQDRTLLVRIHLEKYFISCNVLEQVFSRFGIIENIEILGAENEFHSKVCFKNKGSTLEALDSVNWRNIYDNCCKMELSLEEDFLLSRELPLKCLNESETWSMDSFDEIHNSGDKDLLQLESDDGINIQGQEIGSSMAVHVEKESVLDACIHKCEVILQRMKQIDLNRSDLSDLGVPKTDKVNSSVHSPKICEPAEQLRESHERSSFMESEARLQRMDACIRRNEAILQRMKKIDQDFMTEWDKKQGQQRSVEKMRDEELGDSDQNRSDWSGIGAAPSDMVDKIEIPGSRSMNSSQERSDRSIPLERTENRSKIGDARQVFVGIPREVLRSPPKGQKHESHGRSPFMASELRAALDSEIVEESKEHQRTFDSSKEVVEPFRGEFSMELISSHNRRLNFEAEIIDTCYEFSESVAGFGKFSRALLEIHSAYDMFDEMPIRGFMGNDFGIQLNNANLLMGNWIFDPGDFIDTEFARETALELNKISIMKVAEVDGHKMCSHRLICIEMAAELGISACLIKVFDPGINSMSLSIEPLFVCVLGSTKDETCVVCFEHILSSSVVEAVKERLQWDPGGCCLFWRNLLAIQHHHV